MSLPFLPIPPYPPDVAFELLTLDNPGATFFSCRPIFSVQRLHACTSARPMITARVLTFIAPHNSQSAMVPPDWLSSR